VRFQRIFSSISMAAVLSGGLCSAASAGTSSGFTYTVMHETATITGCSTTCPTDLIIPRVIDGYPVGTIGDVAFSRNSLSSVTIPSSVTSIGNWAFQFNKLTSVTIPSSVTTIGNGAFASNELTSLTIPSSVTGISEVAFENNNLSSITIPSSVTSIGEEAFASNNLTSVTIPSSVTRIGIAAFAENKLTSLTIPSSVVSIGGYAFVYNNLSSVTIPNSVANIGYGAFDGNPLSKPIQTSPDRPSLVSLDAGSRSATVSWMAPSANGGRAITGYTVTCVGGGLTKTATTTASVTSSVIRDLVNGTTYLCSVTAKNAKGTSGATDLWEVTPVGVPSAPTSVIGIAGSGQVTVNWTTGTDNGGSPLTGFVIQAKVGSTVVKTVAAGVTDRAAVVTGLTNGTSYTFSVSANNAVGGSVAKTSSALTPVTTSQSPTINAITPSTGALTVAFTPPIDNGGSKVLRYEYSVDGGPWVNSAKPITKSPFMVTGLANATSYAIRVRAVTAVGNGEVSTSVSGLTPTIVASAPTITTFLPGKTSITVNFTAPTNNGGAAVTNYAYTLDGTAWTTLSPASSNTPIVITGLTSYKSYNVKLRAINSAGLGAISASKSVKTLK
jgi:BspA type Leucine rich repeat region (6 copies)/Fibronectin type III domain